MRGRRAAASRPEGRSAPAAPPAESTRVSTSGSATRAELEFGSPSGAAEASPVSDVGRCRHRSEERFGSVPTRRWQRNRSVVSGVDESTPSSRLRRPGSRVTRRRRSPKGGPRHRRSEDPPPGLPPACAASSRSTDSSGWRRACCPPAFPKEGSAKRLSPKTRVTRCALAPEGPPPLGRWRLTK